MTFKEAYTLYLDGIRVRRKGWPNKEYWLGKVRCRECGCELEYEDAIADDWEFIV